MRKDSPNWGICSASTKTWKCERIAISKKWMLCNAHYLQRKNPGFKEYKPPQERINGALCIAPGCPTIALASLLCGKHYQQKRSHGTVFPEGTDTLGLKILYRDEQGRKKCSTCLKFLDEVMFSYVKRTRDGLSARCKECSADRRRDIKYGMRPGGFRELLDKQGGVCAICDTDTPRTWTVDHDHGCCPGEGSCGGCIRGVLCSKCNTALGQFLDSETVLLRAAEYIRNHEKGIL